MEKDSFLGRSHDVVKTVGRCPHGEDDSDLETTRVHPGRAESRSDQRNGDFIDLNFSVLTVSQ